MHTQKLVTYSSISKLSHHHTNQFLPKICGGISLLKTYITIHNKANKQINPNIAHQRFTLSFENIITLYAFLHMFSQKGSIEN